MSGDYPGNTRKKRAVIKAEREHQTGLALVETNTNDDGSDPARIRPSLARLAAANLSELQRGAARRRALRIDHSLGNGHLQRLPDT